MTDSDLRNLPQRKKNVTLIIITMKFNQKTIRMFPMSIFVALLGAVAITGCSDAVSLEDYIVGTKTAPYDPSRSVVISDFTPSEGGVGQQIVITGENFGNSTALVKVMIGGKKAVVNSVKSNAIYCFVPSHAFSGVIEVIVGDNAQNIKEQTAVASEKFVYRRKMVVGTLAGYKDEDDKQGWSPSGTSFDKVTGFRNDGVMQFSPYNHNQLFVVYDQEPYHGTVAHSIQLLDLEKKIVSDVLPLSMFNSERLRTIDFIVDPYAYDEDGQMVATGSVVDENTESPTYGQELPTYFATPAWEATATPTQLKWREHIIVSADNYNDQFTATSAYIVDRDQRGNFSNTSPHRILAAYNQCNGAAVHPNGEVYFNSFTRGEMLRLDMNKYWETLIPSYSGPVWNPRANENFHDATTGENQGTGAFELLYKIQDNGFECQIDIHPKGNYAYIVVINHEYILKTDYNAIEKRFTAPYQVAGSMNARGNTDGVGKNALLSRPYQGTFAVNKDYQKEGRDDIYDFFFCDSGVYDENDLDGSRRFGSTIRCLTPQGIVSTYAGGGAATHADGYVIGSENGELRDVARFYRPTGLVSDWNEAVLDEEGKPTRIFYILDTMNRQIRTIGYEHEENEETPATPAKEDNAGK